MLLGDGCFMHGRDARATARVVGPVGGIRIMLGGVWVFWIILWVGGREVLGDLNGLASRGANQCAWGLVVLGSWGGWVDR